MDGVDEFVIGSEPNVNRDKDSWKGKGEHASMGGKNIQVKGVCLSERRDGTAEVLTGELVYQVRVVLSRESMAYWHGCEHSPMC